MGGIKKCQNHGGSDLQRFQYHAYGGKVANMPESKDQDELAFPRIPAKNWWELRKKALNSPPSSISKEYLSSVLGLGEGAASNLLPSLRLLGLIDDKGNTVDALHEWRHDQTYPTFCESAIRRIYPQELLSAAPPPDPDVEVVIRWFSMKKKVGMAAAKQMAATYALLANADPSAAQAKGKPRSGASGVGTIPSKSVKKEKPARPDAKKVVSTPSESGVSIHFNLQVHISPESSPEQIDRVFESIAKHLGKVQPE